MSEEFQERNQPAGQSRFYVAKAEDAQGNLRKPITLYALDNAFAESAVKAMQIVSKDDRVYVRAVDAIHERGFGRSFRDGRGVVYHESHDWSGQRGPISATRLFP